MNYCATEATLSWPSDRSVCLDGRMMKESPDSSLGSLEDLLCGEKMEASPCPWSSLSHSSFSCYSSTMASSNSSRGAIAQRPHAQRLVSLEYDARQYGSRALEMKLREQSITFLADRWHEQVDKRQQYWMQAFMYFLEHAQSQEVLQLSISFLDRFVGTFKDKYQGQVTGSPLACLFEASLHIVEQLLDDTALHKSPANNNGHNIQLTVEMMLQVTDWEVIDWTPASFVPHFMEIAQVRRVGGAMLYQQTLALATLFIIDGEVASRVVPSAIAALAVTVQAWLTLHLWSKSQASDAVEQAPSLPRSIDFLRHNLCPLLQAANISPQYFGPLADFALQRLFRAEYHDGLDALTILAFCLEMEETFGALPLLQAASLATLTKPNDHADLAYTNAKHGLAVL